MAEITSLTTLSKASVASTDYFVVANSSTKKAKKLQVQSMFPTLNTLGTGSESLYISTVSSNQINIKGLKSADTTKLTVTTDSNNLVLTLVEAGIDLNNCDNTTSGFLTSINLDGTVSGTLSVLRGGTGLTGVTKGSVLFSNATNTVSEASLTANGNILVGNTTNGYPSVGAITSTGGTITIDASTTPGNINLEAASTNSLSAHLDCNTYNINLDDAAGNSWLSGDSTNEGVHVDADGKVYVGDQTPTLFGGSGQLNIIGESTTYGIAFGNTSGTYGKGGSLKWLNRTSSGNGMNAEFVGADGHTNGNGGDFTIQAGAGAGSGNGGAITLEAGDAASGSAGEIILKTYTAGGVKTTALTVDDGQNIRCAKGLASASGIVGPTYTAKVQIANGFSGALDANTHYLAPADGNAITATLPTIANSHIGDAIVVEWQVAVTNGQTQKFGTSGEYFMEKSCLYIASGTTGAVFTTSIADGAADDFLNITGVTNAAPGIKSKVTFTFNGAKWIAEGTLMGSGNMSGSATSRFNTA